MRTVEMAILAATLAICTADGRCNGITDIRWWKSRHVEEADYGHEPWAATFGGRGQARIDREPAEYEGRHSTAIGPNFYQEATIYCRSKFVEQLSMVENGGCLPFCCLSLPVLLLSCAFEFLLLLP
jgi:hypothetical protein